MRAVDCPEKDHLLAEFNKAVVEQSTTTKALADYAGTMPLAEYELLKVANDMAKARTETARFRYNRHIEQHRCGRLLAPAAIPR